MPTTTDKRTATLEQIAQDKLGITLEERGLDDLDFHDLGVWNVAAALEAAYLAGAASRTP